MSTNLFAQEISQFELTSIEFQGNKSLPSELLSTILISQESPGWLSKFLNSFTSFGEEAIYFDSLLIETDLVAIKSVYEANGFFKYNISANYSLDTLNLEANLHFNINEGDPAVFRHMDFTGFENLPQDILIGIIKRTGIDSTERYSNAEVEKNVGSVLSFLRDNGYVFAESNSPIVSVDTLLNRADVEINFTPGKSYKVREIRVQKSGEGQENVEDELIKDIVGIEPGNTYSYNKMRRGQIRLYRTNLFTSALVTAVTADTVNHTIPIGINTDVGRIYEISPEIIMSDEESTFNLGFALGFTKKNFFGSARKVSLNLSTAAQNITSFISNPSLNDTTLFGYADARIVMEQPFLFGLPIDTKFETYYTLQKRKAEYNAILYGIKIGFDFELPAYTYFNSLTAYFNLENSHYRFRDSYIETNISAFKKIYPDVLIDTTKISNTSENINALVGIGLGANKTDDFLYPTTGYNLSLLLEDGNFLAYTFSKITKFTFSDPIYYRIIANSAFYFPLSLSKKAVFAFKLKSGYIRAYRGNKFDIPLNQRFYSGGSNSVRGWNTRELVPRGTNISLPENPTSEELEAILSRGLIPGGFFMFEGSVEARLRLVGAVGSAFFIDYGNTWNSFSEVTPKNIAVAIGFGLRYYSQIVPIRLDFGFRLYDPQDQRSMFSRGFKDVFQFHLGIGEAF